MIRRSLVLGLIVCSLAAAAFFAFRSSADVVSAVRGPAENRGFDRAITDNNARLINEGRQIFRFDTFGDEAFWGDTLKLHRAIAGAAHGGVGAGVSPKTALSVGLKVDADAIPGSVAAGVKSGAVNLDDPATTLALLKLNAVVGLTGVFDDGGNLK